MLAAVGAKLQVVQAWCVCDGARMAGFPENTSRTDYIRKILQQCVIARASAEDFNVAAVRSYQGEIDNKISHVNEASVSHVDE